MPKAINIKMKFRLLYACSTSCLSVSAENIMWATWHTKTSNLLLRRKNNIYSHKSSKNYVELFCVSVYKQNKNASLFLPFLIPFYLLNEKIDFSTTTSCIWIYFVPHKKTDFEKYYMRRELNCLSTKSTHSFWLYRI